MSNKKQTAVEWLIDKLEKHYVHHDLKNTVVFEQAKTMEKEQIMDAYDDGIKAGYGDYIDVQWGRDGKELTAEQYYNETYNKTAIDGTN